MLGTRDSRFIDTNPRPILTKTTKYSDCRVAKFKHPRVLDDHKLSEDNQELRPGCPPDYQIFCERVDPKKFHPNKSFKLSFSYQQKTAV